MVELEVEGMTCGHCERAVRAALESVPGVASARVSLAAGKAVVEGAAEAEDLVAAVAEEGYRARPLPRPPEGGAR